MKDRIAISSKFLAESAWMLGHRARQTSPSETTEALRDKKSEAQGRLTVLRVGLWETKLEAKNRNFL